ncbi:MAG: glycosyltransferase family 4 protein [Asticcacaulis sp.]
MKIAVVLPPSFTFCVEKPHSIETVVRTMMIGPDFGHDVRVFCDKGANNHGNVSVTTVDTGGSKSQRDRNMARALSDYDPNYTEFHHSAKSARLFAKAIPNSIRSFYRHNYIKHPKNWLQRFEQQRRYGAFDRFIFVSNGTREDFLSAFPQFSARAHSVFNPIDASIWASDPAAKKKTIVFAARAMPEKGLAPLCDALALALPSHPDWRAVLILGGFDTHKDWAQEQIDKLVPLGAQTEVLKNQPLQVVRENLQSASIAVIPSLWQDPFPLSGLEAHAAGCAVISSGSGGLRDISGPHALYLDKTDGPNIADALTRLMNDEDLRHKLMSGGLNYARTEHTIIQRATELNTIREYGRPSNASVAA